MYVAVNGGFVYYLIKKKNIVVGWSNVQVSPNDADTALLWHHFKTNTNLTIQEEYSDGIMDLICSDKSCNQVEYGFKADADKKNMFYLQFIVGDEQVAFRTKIPDTKGAIPNEYAEILLHQNVAPWEIQVDTAENFDQIFLGADALPLTFISAKNYSLYIYEIPVGKEIIRIRSKASEKYRYYFINDEFEKHNDFLYSAWRVFEIEENVSAK